MPEDNVPTVITDNENVINEETTPAPALPQEIPETPPQPELNPQPTPEPTPEIIPETTPPVKEPAPDPPVEPPPAPEPIIETPPPVVVEPAPEPEPTPPIAPTPDSEEPPKAPIQDKPKEPEKAPTPEPITQPAPEAPTPEPSPTTNYQPPTTMPSPSPSKDGIPQKVLDLTPEELDAARRLWAREHISQAQKKANESRHARMLERMAEIEKFVKANPGCSVHETALEVGLSEKLTSGYLQKLVHTGRVRASGNTGNRRFS